jgi:hypothetical protein
VTIRATAMVLACVIALGATAVGFVMAPGIMARAPSSADPSPELITPAQSTNTTAKTDIELHPNREAKRDRLSLALAATDPRFSESMPATPGDLMRESFDAISAFNNPSPEGAGTASPEADKKAPGSPIAHIRNPLLNDAQIDSIKKRLKLTPAQDKYWPPVRTALYGLITSHEAKRRKAGRNKTVPIDPASGEVTRLRSAAGSLFTQLRADQKRELQMLARIIGLDTALAKL